MITTGKEHSQECKDDAVELFLASDLPIAQVSLKVRAKVGTLGNWIKKYRQEHSERFDTDDRESVPIAEHQRLMAENAKLKRESEFLGTVTFFTKSRRFWALRAARDP